LKLDSTRPPDLLRRFVATPYVFMNSVGSHRCSIRSNDLEIALAVRGYWSSQKHEKRSSVNSWQLIRETLAAENTTDITLLRTLDLRMLMVGTETILFYDIQRSELLGFVSPTTTAKYLVSELIPRLVESSNTPPFLENSFTNK
jgi:hypothetical protein